MENEIAHDSFFLLGKKSFLKSKLGNTETTLTEKRPHDSETKNANFYLVFHHDMQYSTDHLIVLEAHSSDYFI